MSSFIGLIASLLARFAGRFLSGWVLVFFTVAIPLIAKIVAMLSFTAVTLVGINLVFNKFTAHFLNSVNGLPSDVIHMMGIMQLDVALSLIVSAITLKQIMRGWDMLAGSKTETAWNPPSSPGDSINTTYRKEFEPDTPWKL